MLRNLQKAYVPFSSLENTKIFCGRSGNEERKIVRMGKGNKGKQTYGKWKRAEWGRHVVSTETRQVSCLLKEIYQLFIYTERPHSVCHESQ